MKHTHAVEYYSALENSEILPYTTTRMDLEDITLSEEASHRTRMAGFHLHEANKVFSSQK